MGSPPRSRERGGPVSYSDASAPTAWISAGTSPEISRARNPMGRRMRRGELPPPVEEDAPERRPHRLDASCQDAGDDPGERVPRSGGREAHAAAAIVPAFAVRRDDPALGALHDHHGPQQIGGLTGGLQRLSLDRVPLPTEELRHLARMGGEDRMSLQRTHGGSVRIETAKWPPRRGRSVPGCAFSSDRTRSVVGPQVLMPGRAARRRSARPP